MIDVIFNLYIIIGLFIGIYAAEADRRVAGLDWQEYLLNLLTGIILGPIWLVIRLYLEIKDRIKS